MKKLIYYLLPVMLLSCRDNNSVEATSEEKVKTDTKPGEISNEVKTYTAQNVTYHYVSDVLPDENETFFKGTKLFKGYVNDIYRVVINGNNIAIYDMKKAGKAALLGYIQKGKIIDGSGRTGKFIYRNEHLYYNGEMNEWYVFNELKEL